MMPPRPFIPPGTCKYFFRDFNGNPNTDPQEHSKNIIENKDTGRYIPIIFLPYSWGSLFGAPISTLLKLNFGVQSQVLGFKL